MGCSYRLILLFISFHFNLYDEIHLMNKNIIIVFTTGSMNSIKHFIIQTSNTQLSNLTQSDEDTFVVSFSIS